MLELLRSWILTVVGTALVCGIVRALAPEGTGKKAVLVVCGFVMLGSVLGVRGAAPGSLEAQFESFTEEAEEIARRAQESGSAQTRFIIESRCEAYILDKAAAMESPVSGVSVTARWSGDGFWVPAECSVDGDWDAALAGVIASELGIPAERQTWGTVDG